MSSSTFDNNHAALIQAKLETCRWVLPWSRGPAIIYHSLWNSRAERLYISSGGGVETSGITLYLLRCTGDVLRCVCVEQRGRRVKKPAGPLLKGESPGAEHTEDEGAGGFRRNLPTFVQLMLYVHISWTDYYIFIFECKCQIDASCLFFFSFVIQLLHKLALLVKTERETWETAVAQNKLSLKVRNLKTVFLYYFFFF